MFGRPPSTRLQDDLLHSSGVDAGSLSGSGWAFRIQHDGKASNNEKAYLLRLAQKEFRLRSFEEVRVDVYVLKDP